MASFVVASISAVPVSIGHCDIGHVSPISRMSTKSPRQSECVEPNNELKRARSVMFEGADIVEFEPTIFTTTVTSGGVPVGLSNKERRRIRRRLDSFELERKDERVCRQNYMEEGYLYPDERAAILGNAGCEASSFEKVEAEVNLIIAHRRESNEMDVQCMYGLGEYEQEDLNSDCNQVDKDDDDPSPFYGNYFSTDDTTHEWKQTLDIIAFSDMENEAIQDNNNGLWNKLQSKQRCTNDEESIFSLTSSEQYSDLDLSSDLDLDLQPV